MIRLENVLKTSLQDVLKMSWRRLEDVLKMSWGCFEDVLNMSWRCLSKMSWRCLEDVWKCLEGVLARRFEDVFARRIEDVLKMYDQDEYIDIDYNVLKMSSEDVWIKRIFWSWSRRLENEDGVFIKKNASCIYS